MEQRQPKTVDPPWLHEVAYVDGLYEIGEVQTDAIGSIKVRPGQRASIDIALDKIVRLRRLSVEVASTEPCAVDPASLVDMQTMVGNRPWQAGWGTVTSVHSHRESMAHSQPQIVLGSQHITLHFHNRGPTAAVVLASFAYDNFDAGTNQRIWERVLQDALIEGGRPPRGPARRAP